MKYGKIIKEDSFTVYTYKDIKIYNADALKVLAYLNKKNIKVELIVTDPPYDIKNTKAGGTSHFNKTIEAVNDELRKAKLDICLGTDWINKAKLLQDKLNIYIWCNNNQVPMYYNYFLQDNKIKHNMLIWNKTNAVPTFYNKYLTDKEYCLYFKKGGYCKPQNYEDAKSIWYQPINLKDKKKYGHPTIKPLNIIQTIIRNSSREQETILDCFLGSGTTAVASILENRKFIGVELSEEYFKIAIDRIEEFIEQDLVA